MMTGPPIAPIPGTAAMAGIPFNEPCTNVITPGTRKVRTVTIPNKHSHPNPKQNAMMHAQFRRKIFLPRVASTSPGYIVKE